MSSFSSPGLAWAHFPVSVLKFGGSVLWGPGAVSTAAAEIRRTLTRGSRIVAVTSAFHGVTQSLLEQSKEQFDAPAGKPLAQLLATGESRAAAFVALALDDAGIPCELLEPSGIGLSVTGPFLDAEPRDVDTELVSQALSRAPVLVVPGFFGHRSDGSLALLGRGGSDLTALFLAQRLGARSCRLVKDVDGLYDRDPRSVHSTPTRYETASLSDVERLGGGLVQKKALDFARKYRLGFTIAAPLSERGTRVPS